MAAKVIMVQGTDVYKRQVFILLFCVEMVL